MTLQKRKESKLRAMRTSKKLGAILFLLWLFFVNVFYYVQFRKLAVLRLPWLANLWH
jgi:hypothetical protein